MDDIVLFNECSLENISNVGKKAAFIAELYSKGFNVPPGLIITGNLFVKFVELTGIKQNVAEVLVSNEEVERKSMKIQQIILNTPFPSDMADFIYKSYMRFANESGNEPFVSLKVSSTSDYVEDSFFLNIQGKERLINGIKSCWASVFSEKNIGLKRFKPSIVVQKMTNPVKSGYVYSRNPFNGNEGEVVIQVCSGLGNAISLKQAIPSVYIIRKEDGKVIGSEMKEQRVQYKLSMEKRRTEKIEMDEPMQNVLDQHVISELVQIATKAENRLGDPTRISFSIDNRISITSAKPIDAKDFNMRFSEAYSLSSDQGEGNEADQNPSGGHMPEQENRPPQSNEVPPQTGEESNNGYSYSNTDGNQITDSTDGQQEQPRDDESVQQAQHQAHEANQDSGNDNDESILEFYQPEVHHSQENQHDEPQPNMVQQYQGSQHNENQQEHQSVEEPVKQEPQSQTETTATKDEFMDNNMGDKPTSMLKKTRFSYAMNIVNCDMLVTSALRSRYRSLFGKDAPSSRDAMLAELKSRVDIPFENEIQKIRAARNDFLEMIKEPSDDFLESSMKIARQFCERF